MSDADTEPARSKPSEAEIELSRESVALHEASHCICAQSMGVEVVWASIKWSDADPDSYGRVALSRRDLRRLSDERHNTIDAAGGAGQKIAGIPVHLSIIGDRALMERRWWASHPSVKRQWPEPLWSKIDSEWFEAEARARDILKAHWPAVLHVQQLLLDNETITGPDIPPLNADALVRKSAVTLCQ